MHQPSCTAQGARFFLQGVRHGVICIAACSSPFPLENCSATQLLAQFPPPCRVIHSVVFVVCLLAGFRFVNETTFVVLFLRSMRPLLCLLKRPPPPPTQEKNEKYRAERPPFLFSFGVRASIHTLPTKYSKFAYLSIDFRYMLGGTLLKAAGRHPQRLRRFCDDF